MILISIFNTDPPSSTQHLLNHHSIPIIFYIKRLRQELILHSWYYLLGVYGRKNKRREILIFKEMEICLAANYLKKEREREKIRWDCFLHLSTSIGRRREFNKIIGREDSIECLASKRYQIENCFKLVVRSEKTEKERERERKDGTRQHFNFLFTPHKFTIFLLSTLNDAS